LPPGIDVKSVPVAEALVALANRLAEICETMPTLSDIEVRLDIEPIGRASLYCRAYR
jgi:hypothetical protein